MSWFYLDAAGLMKKYRTEPGSAFVLELFALKDDRETFITSYVATIETNGVIARLRNAQVLSEAAANILLGDIARDMNDPIRVLPVSSPVLGLARNYARIHGLKAADAIHLGTYTLAASAALPAACHFVSSDKRLLKVCATLSFTTLDPEEPAALRSLRSSRQTR